MRILASIPFALLLLSCQDNAAFDTMNVDDAASGNDSAPKFPCAAIENLLATADDCADLTAMKEDVKPGPAALDTPATMVRGDSYEVTLIIDRPEPPPPPAPSEPLDDATNAMDDVTNDVAPVENIADDLEPAAGTLNQMDAAPTANEVAAQLPGQDTRFRARVGRYMKATLTGAGFKIKPISPLDGLQEIPRGDQGRWQWEVTPTAEGRRRLTVKTQAMGKIDGRMVPLGNGDTSQDVNVEVSWPDRIWDVMVAMPAWIKALAAIFVALGTLISAVGPVRRAFLVFVSRLFQKRKTSPRK